MKERGKHTHRKKTRKRRVSEGSLFLPLINISIIHIIKLYVTIFNSFPSPCLLSLTTHITHHTHHVFTRKPRNREKLENPIVSRKWTISHFFLQRLWVWQPFWQHYGFSSYPTVHKIIIKIMPYEDVKVRFILRNVVETSSHRKNKWNNLNHKKTKWNNSNKYREYDDGRGGWGD